MENQPQNIEELEIIISESLVKTFHTFEELKEFIDSEKSYFEFLKKTIQFDHNLNSPISTMFRVYDDVISKTTQMLP